MILFRHIGEDRLDHVGEFFIGRLRALASSSSARRCLYQALVILLQGPTECCWWAVHAPRIQGSRSSTGILAMLQAIRRASSRDCPSSSFGENPPSNLLGIDNRTVADC